MFFALRAITTIKCDKPGFWLKVLLNSIQNRKSKIQNPFDWVMGLTLTAINI